MMRLDELYACHYIACPKSPPDMENVENRRIFVRTYRLLAILSCHRDVLQDSLFILKTAYRQKSDLIKELKKKA